MKIIAALNLILTIIVLVKISKTLIDANHKVREEFKSSIQRPLNWDRIKLFFKRNALYFWGQMFRLSMFGIFAINLNQFDSSLLGIKPDISYMVASLFFYVSLTGYISGLFNESSKKNFTD